jgi:alpha-glucoside transport system substrate-binding protein
MHRWGLSAVAAGSLAVAALAGCGSSSDDNDGGGSTTPSTTADKAAAVSGSISIAGVWTGEEQKSFQAVIDAFNEQYPDVTVKYQPAGDNLPTVLSTAVEGGNPPDLAAIAQPGLIKEFQSKGALQPLDFAADTLQANYPPDFLKLGTIDGKLYDFVFKGANKSTVWYNVAAFRNAGIEAPQSWDDFVAAARTLKASGVPAYSIGGADGWTLTDLFENIYLRQAGGDMYDQLTDHSIKWTDPSVKAALRTMAAILGDTDNVAGGSNGALQTDFPTSVSNVFASSPRAAMVIEGDFVPGVVAGKSPLKAESGYNAFPFPAIGDAANAVVGGGDSIAVFRDSPAAEAFVNFLASPDGASVWVKRGGFSTPNKNVSADDYPDAITRTVAQPLANAETFRFDMSDLAPAAFGGTAGQGEWKTLQDFLANPKDVDGTASKLEAQAAKAYKG